MDYSDLQKATEQHSRLSIELDKLLKSERDAKLTLLQKLADIRKELFPKLASKEITHALFSETLKNETFLEMVEYEKHRTSRIIKENQLDACKEVLYSVKKQISLT